MKHHYLDCQIPDLTNRSLSWSSGRGNTPLGLRGSTPGEKKYAPLVPAAIADLVKGTVESIYGDVRLLQTSISKLIGHIYGGPLPLLDPTWAFKIPCKQIDQQGVNDWAQKYMIGGNGRYGHPLTPISLLALQTLQLPADMDLKNNMCQRPETAVPCEELE